MAQITVVGTGYVGTVTSVCLAWLGQEVVGVDTDRDRIRKLSAGHLPFHEPGLPEKLRDALTSGRLSFTTDSEDPSARAEIVFLCVGTPPGANGLPDMSQMEAAVASVARRLSPEAVIVNKSTVPVGSGNWVRTF